MTILIIGILTLLSLPLPSFAALSYGSGVYTNLCGTGYSATSDTCNRGCNTGGGYCSASNNTVVKYTCDGQVSECRGSESEFTTNQSLAGTPCGKTVQIDVFNKTCRTSNGEWSCGNGDMIDYMVWYSGNCPSQPNPTKKPKPTKTPTPKPTKTSTPAPTPIVQNAACDGLDIASGNNAFVPANVVLRARAHDNLGNIQQYRFYFGDGNQTETSNIEVTHRYESSGSFRARVDVKDSRGNWRSSGVCEATVTVKSLPIESHKSNCSNVFITQGNNTQAPTTAKFTVTGFDNKGAIKRYKLDFGNGNVRESESHDFEENYNSAGTYVIRGYVLDSKDNWKGGENDCRKQLYVNTEPLTSQPKTGTSTVFTLTSIFSGFIGVTLLKLRKYFIA